MGMIDSLLGDQIAIKLNKGCYFDRGVDLYFYREKGAKPVYILRTPPSGLKPAISVVGNLIEGSYGVDTVISVQNLSYDLDIQDVSFIDCRMYYFGIERGKNPMFDLIPKRGRQYMFSVLYTDQDKQPPNRNVMFRCTVAAQSKELFDVGTYINSGGAFVKMSDAPPPNGGGSKKNGASNITKTVSTYLWELAGIRNKYVEEKYKGMPMYDGALINDIILPKDVQEWNVLLEANSPATFGSLLRRLNSYRFKNDDKAGCVALSAAVSGNSIVVSKIVPDNWEELAAKQGCVTDVQKRDFFSKNYEGEMVRIKLNNNSSNGSASNSFGTISNPVPLNFVIAAYRSENIIKVQTLYDDRIKPGVYCSIDSRAIMGKKSGRSGTRILEVGKNTVFRVTGNVQFEFSTTSVASMTFLGPTV